MPLPESPNSTGDTGAADTPVARLRILVVDDDREIRDLVSQSLIQHGFDALTAADATAAEKLYREMPLDLIILDVMMPGEDGLSFCRRISLESKVPIIILSALDASNDRIVGLELGADGYVGKPCEPRELIANIKAVLRRSRTRVVGAPEIGRTAEFGGWQLDLIGRFLRSPQSVVIDLAASEFMLLRHLVERPQRTLSRDALLNALHGVASDVFDRAIDVQISRLRSKLGADGTRFIKTVRNEGYVFTPAVVMR